MKGVGKYSEVNKPIIWGSKAHGGWESCQECGTTRRRHKGAGLCLRCYDRARDKKKRRQEQKKKAHDSWYARVKGTPKYKKYTNERAKIWRETSPLYRGFLYKRYERQRLKRFLKGGRIKKDYVRIVCECCNKQIVAPFKAHQIEEKQTGFELFKKMIIEIHSQQDGPCNLSPHPPYYNQSSPTGRLS